MHNISTAWDFCAAASAAARVDLASVSAGQVTRAHGVINITPSINLYPELEPYELFNGGVNGGNTSSEVNMQDL